VFAIIGEATSRRPNSTGLLALIVFAGVYLAIFVAVLRTAGHLRDNFERTYRRARWMGIVMATLFCPVLTVPAIVGIRQLRKCQEAGVLATLESPP
jgi:threonine/homoserine/homoserine lactone efflux protein